MLESYIIKLSNVKKEYRVKAYKQGILNNIKILFEKKYKIVRAVDGISINIKYGEIRGLLGPNGAGKSTTIKLLTGILHPSEGEIDVMGYKPWIDRMEYVKNIGVILGQKSQLIWDIAPLETYKLHKSMYNIPESKFNQNLKYFCKILDIDEVIKKPVRFLSLGERMKCEFVCSLLHDPKIVFLDEPTIGLDIIAKESIRRFIKEINKSKRTTFILTTHDLSDVEELCDNITVISNGHVVVDDSIDNLKNLFSEKKVIDFKFSDEVNIKKFSDLDVVCSDTYSVSIRVDNKEEYLNKVIRKVVNEFNVIDINISKVSIDDIIKRCYIER